MNIDLCCGNKKCHNEWIGVDTLALPGVDVVSDALEYLKMLEANTVNRVNMSHCLEHFTPEYRVALFNELGRVVRPGGKVLIESPNFDTAAAYGDPTHVWPPISAWTFVYLDKQTREDTPHVNYTCDFVSEKVGVALRGTERMICAILVKRF